MLIAGVMTEVLVDLGPDPALGQLNQRKLMSVFKQLVHILYIRFFGVIVIWEFTKHRRDF